MTRDAPVRGGGGGTADTDDSPDVDVGDVTVEETEEDEDEDEDEETSRTEQIRDGIEQRVESAAAATESVRETASDTVDRVRDTGGDAIDRVDDAIQRGSEVIDSEFEGPRSPTARQQVGPVDSRLRAQVADQTAFDEEDVVVTQEDGQVRARVEDEARIEAIEQQILDEREELEAGDIDVEIDDGEVVAETPPDFDSDIPVVGDRVEEFRAGQFRRSQRIDEFRSDAFGVDAAEEFEADGVEELQPDDASEFLGELGRAALGDAQTIDPETGELEDPEIREGISPTFGRGRTVDVSTRALAGAAGLGGAAAAGEAQRRDLDREGETLTIEDGGEIEITEDLGVGQPEIDVDDGALAEDLAELGVPTDAEQFTEIDAPEQLQRDAELGVPTEEGTGIGIIDTQQLIGGRATKDDPFEEADEDGVVIEETDDVLDEIERREREELVEIARQGQEQAEFEVEERFGEVRDDIDVIERDTETQIIEEQSTATEDIQPMQDVVDVPGEELTPFQRQILRGRMVEEETVDQEMIDEAQRILDEDSVVLPGQETIARDLADESVTTPELEALPEQLEDTAAVPEFGADPELDVLPGLDEDVATLPDERQQPAEDTAIGPDTRLSDDVSDVADTDVGVDIDIPELDIGVGVGSGFGTAGTTSTTTDQQLLQQQTIQQPVTTQPRGPRGGFRFGLPELGDSEADPLAGLGTDVADERVEFDVPDPGELGLGGGRNG